MFINQYKLDILVSTGFYADKMLPVLYESFTDAHAVLSLYPVTNVHAILSEM